MIFFFFSQLGPLAEALLDKLREGDSDVALTVDKVRNETRDEKRKKALAQREKMLADMGFVMKSHELGGKILSSVKPKGIEELEGFFFFFN